MRMRSSVKQGIGLTGLDEAESWALSPLTLTWGFVITKKLCGEVTGRGAACS